MDKALEMGKTSCRGGFQLFIGQAFSTIIAAVATIILARLMLPEEYGLYAVALIPSTMINLFHDWGIGPAMTKYIAYYRAANREEDIHDIIAAGLIFKIATGLALTLSSLALASFIAITVFNRPESTSLIAIASTVIFSESLLTAIRYIFMGFERMELNSLTMISYSIIKTIASPLLVFLGYGALGAVLGYTFSFLSACILGIIVLYFILFRKLPKRTNPCKSNLNKTLKTMLRFGVPFSIATILGGLLTQFYSFMMVIYCNNAMIGNYQIAANFAVLLTFLTFPISTVLFPAFSKLDPKNEHQLVQTVFTSSVKYTAILLVPATMAVMVLSKPMIYTLYGEEWVYAPLFLSLYVITNLLVLFGGLVKNSLLAGLGETKMLMKISLLTLALGIPLAFILIPPFGIIGVILGTLFATIPSFIYGLYWIWKHYNVKADFKASAKIFAASTIAATTTYISLTFLNTAEWIQLIIGGTIFLTTYIFTAPMIGAITQTEINNIRTMLSGLGIITRIVNIPLTIAEKVAALATI
ncbi:MAG: oligosaccharide flippase family protein [Candidatus Bathyarchaeia archaeon]